MSHITVNTTLPSGEPVSVLIRKPRQRRTFYAIELLGNHIYAFDTKGQRTAWLTYQARYCHEIGATDARVKKALRIETVENGPSV